MKYQKYLKPRKKKKKKKKKDDGYDLKIFMVINTHKKHPYNFFIHDSMSITIKPANINYKSNITKIILQIHNIKNINCLNITHS